MKGGRAELNRADKIRRAVEKATRQGRLASVGARIEEILGFPLERYPDEILPLSLLPTLDGFKFIGWTEDFAQVECQQDQVGETYIISASIPIVGWKPIRVRPLTGRIA